MPVSRSTGEETNFVPGQAVFELTMHQCIEAGQAFDFGYGDLKALCRHFAISLPSHELRSTFSALDEDCSGAISYKELCYTVFPETLLWLCLRTS